MYTYISHRFICIFLTHIHNSKKYSIFLTIEQRMHRNNRVTIALNVNGLQAGRPIFWVAAGARNLSLFQNIQSGFEAHSASYSVARRALSPEVKRPVLEDDYSPSYNAEFKKDWKYTSKFPVCFHGLYRASFNFLIVTSRFVLLQYFWNFKILKIYRLISYKIFSSILRSKSLWINLHIKFPIAFLKFPAAQDS